MLRRIRWRIVLALGASTLLVGAGTVWLIGRPPRDIRELRAIRDRGIELLEAAGPASDPTAQAGKREEWARQCLELNDRYPNQAGGLGALWLAACWAPETTSGSSASRTLVESIRTVDLEPLFSGEERSGVRQSIVGPAELPSAIARSLPPSWSDCETTRINPGSGGGHAGLPDDLPQEIGEHASRVV